MDDALKERLRSKTAATEAAIQDQKAAIQRIEKAARETQRLTEDQERELCNTAERIFGNWLNPLARDFAKEARFSDTDFTFGSSGSGFVEDSRTKMVRISGYRGNHSSGVLVKLYVESSAALKVSVSYEVQRTFPADSEVSNYFELTMQNELLALKDPQTAGDWVTKSMIDAFDLMNRGDGGL